MATRIDTDAIKDALPVADYAGLLGVELRRSGQELRGICPICDSNSRNPFCVHEDQFICHACSASGDVIDLCKLIEGKNFLDAARHLAELAGIDLDASGQDTTARDSRRAAREARQAQQRAQDAILKQAAELSAPSVWQRLSHSSVPGLDYLYRRGVASMASEVHFTQRHVCLPLRRADGKITNVVFRHMEADALLEDEAKVFSLKRCGTLGTFGDLAQLDQTTGPVIIVEGFFDYLSARVLAPGHLVIGAHGSGRLTDVTRMVAERCPERGLLFVPHADDVGQRKVKEAIAIAQELGIPTNRIQRLDLGEGDLNDYLMTGGTGDALAKAPTLADLEGQLFFPLTDAGNAARFAHIHQKRFRYVAELDRWYRWDGKIWGPAHKQVDLVRAAIEVTDKLERDALMARTKDEKLAQSLDVHARRTQSEGRLNSMVSLARAMPSLGADRNQLDADLFLLSCENGTIDLRTGKLRPHRREDLITVRSPVAYDPDARCPLWDRFIAEVFEPNPDAAVFVQRFAGCSLTGDISAECLLFAHGSGANGKGVLFRQIAKILGPELATTVPSNTFVEKGFGQTSLIEIAKCFGKRAVFISEGKQRDKLDEGLIKQVTGGDAVDGRAPYGQMFNYMPAFKLWMSSNHLPKILGTDDGIWRRFKLVPFKVSFQERRDDQLEKKLAAELPGILAWAVRGCLDWLADGGGLKGLADSPSIAEATTSYRSESDIVGGFLEECCNTQVESARAMASAVYREYRKWIEARGQKPLNTIWFGRELKSRGFEAYRSNGARYYPFGLLCVDRSEKD